MSETYTAEEIEKAVRYLDMFGFSENMKAPIRFAGRIAQRVMTEGVIEDAMAEALTSGRITMLDDGVPSVIRDALTREEKA